MSGESSSSSNEQSNPQAKQWESLMAEEIDQLHPRQEGETKKEYKKRLKDMREKTEAFLRSETEVTDAEGKYTDKYLESKYHQKELDAETKALQMVENINQRLKAGEISQEAADRMKARVDQYLEGRIDDIRQTYADPNAILEEEWVDSPKVMSREDVLDEVQAGADPTAAEGPEQVGATTPDQSGEIAPDQLGEATEQADDSEAEPAEDASSNDDLAKVLADETEKVAALEAETESAEEAEREKAVSEEIVKRAEALLEESEQLSPEEAKRRLAEHQDVLKRAEAIQYGEGFSPDAIAERIDQRVEAERNERLQALEAELDALRPDLAELYAKNRRLIANFMPGKRAEFVEAKHKFSKLLNEYLRLKGQGTYEAGVKANNRALEEKFNAAKEQIEAQMLEFAGGDLSNTEKTPEEIDNERRRLAREAADQLSAEYRSMNAELKTEINVQFIEDMISQEQALEDATIDRLDNGTICRKFVSKVLANKYTKAVLIAAGVTGLAITGIGLGMGIAAGTMSVSFGLTAGGAAAGAGRGALAGAIMSRQDSKNSFVRGFADEAQIREQLKDTDILGEYSDTADAIGNLLDQYDEANRKDRVSNNKRTAISAGIGAAVGALMSGVQVNHEVKNVVPERAQIGETPTHYKATTFDNVDIPEGHGMSTTFSQMGGDPANYDQALEIAHSIDAKYGLVPDSNGVAPGLNGNVGTFAHTYPGTIDTWPADAQAYITEVGNAWAEAGLVPGDTIGGEAIYGTTEKVIPDFVPDAFFNLILQASTMVATGGGVRAANDAINRAPETSNQPTTGTTPEAPVPSTETPIEEPEESEEPQEAAPEAPVSTPQSEASNNPSEAEEPAPEAPAEQSGETSDDAYRALVVESLGGFLDDNGIEIMTRHLQPDADSSDITNWWNNLSGEAKQAVIRFNDNNSETESFAGSAIREWIINHPNQIAEARGNNQA